MKVALLTIWHEKNYGAELQAYATVKALRLLGHSPEMINIQIRQPIVPSFLGRIANLIERVSPANQKFNHFWSKYIPTTKRYNSLSDLYNMPPVADVYMVGSDQVWNPDITKDFWKIFFLDFGSKATRRISYASSFGVESWLYDQYTDIVLNALQRFKDITCREDSGTVILRDTFDIVAECVVDPTLLFSSYEEFVSNIKPNKTLVYYPLSEDVELEKYCEDLARRLGLVPVNTNKKYTIMNKILWDRVGIEQWVKNIANADFVITRSFHGLAFCLIYQKQFAILKSRNDRGTRLDNLLNKLDLRDRFFQDIEQIEQSKPWETPVDYSTVTPRLEKLRYNSWHVLKRMLEY